VDSDCGLAAPRRRPGSQGDVITVQPFADDQDDICGELSGGVNLFNFSQTTSVFAKVDYTFGEDVQGVGGKAGMRVAW
jgi:hypothetical protein